MTSKVPIFPEFINSSCQLVGMLLFRDSSQTITSGSVLGKLRERSCFRAGWFGAPDYSEEKAGEGGDGEADTLLICQDSSVSI